MTDRLCYIGKDHTAYFTDKPIAGDGCVWGDDWDDAPYEHNAGIPYHYTKVVMFDIAMMTTPDWATINSAWSVEDVNAGKVSWLSHYSGDSLFAGATYDEFVKFVEEHQGTVFVPRDRHTTFDRV